MYGNAISAGINTKRKSGPRNAKHGASDITAATSRSSPTAHQGPRMARIKIFSPFALPLPSFVRQLADYGWAGIQFLPSLQEQYTLWLFCFVSLTKQLTRSCRSSKHSLLTPRELNLPAAGREEDGPTGTANTLVYPYSDE